MKKHLIQLSFACILYCLCCLPALADTTYIKFGTNWKYLDIGSAAPTGSGASDWRNVAFNDASWSSGPAELGYGDNKQRTTVSFGSNPSNKYITTYFRKIINIPDISIYGGVKLNTYIDDGAVIYVNGAEVARTNMPAGTPGYNTLASAAAAENGNAITSFTIPAAGFVSGDNIIAVEVHQSAVTSSDLTFDLEMIAQPGAVIFDYNTNWKYLDNGTNQGTAWIAAAFADGSWKSGFGKFGYGDPVNTVVFSGCGTSNYPGAENASPGSCGPKYITTYFRKTFTITGLSNYTGFTMNVYRDDGIAVYVNGTEVKRDLLAAGATYTTTATNATDDGQTVNVWPIAASYFVEGSNTIAVEMHQTSNTSSDLTFGMQLIGNNGNVEPDISRGPLLQMVNGNSITVKWTTISAATSRIKWGTSENALTNSISDNTAVTDHEMTITGLTPDTKYYYAIGSATSIVKGSYRNYFTTAPPSGTTRKIRIGVFGDPGTGNSVQRSSRDNYLSLKNGYNNSELAIMLGDNAYDNGTQSEHTSNFFNIYNNNLFDNHVVFPVPGNHEYANDGTRAIDHAIPYYDIFTVPDNAQSGGLASGTEHYYSFDYGNIHFIMLDSYGIDGGKHLYDDTSAATGSPQALWLKADLAANAGTHKWTIVCMHHPPYTNGTHASGFSTDGEGDLVGLRTKITPILERYGVDMVLTGHSHVYERSFLIKNHTGVATSFTNANKVSSSSARYDGSTGNMAGADVNTATTSCPYFTIDSVTSHGTVYVVAGSAGQIGGGTNSIFPAFYYKNYSGSTGGEAGALYLEVQDNRIDAKFIGNSGTVHDQFTIMKGVNKKTAVTSLVNTPVNMNASWVGSYNWYTVPATSTSTARTLGVTPSAAGSYTYYVSDSLAPSSTCITDTFNLLVTSPLAVSVINYDAVLKNNKVFVQWTTTQEVNSDYFIIERSADGLHYETIMVMNGKGNSSTPAAYEFIDSKPLDGTAWYRLTAVDMDGDKKIAGIRMVSNKNNKGFSISIKPNPAVNHEINTNIQSTKKQSVKIRLSDIRGAEIYSTTMQITAGNNLLKINAAPGTYVLSVEAQDGSGINEKVIVK